MKHRVHASGPRWQRASILGDRPAFRGPGGFTLVELFVVIAIVAVLASLLLPAMSSAKALAKRIQCVSNLHQMVIAAQVYVDDHDGFYPIAYFSGKVGETPAAFSWDLTTLQGNPPTVVPGVLWQGSGTREIQQCPSFKGGANWLVDPYTGYNYNTSYLGHGEFESIQKPSKATEVRHPARTLIFGDGQYAAGANKFMRAPWPNPGDETFRGRWSGTQGFRHQGKSNAAFCDGHADSLRQRFTENKDGAAGVATGTGFLSKDNDLYDLD